MFYEIVVDQVGKLAWQLLTSQILVLLVHSDEKQCFLNCFSPSGSGIQG